MVGGRSEIKPIFESKPLKRSSSSRVEGQKSGQGQIVLKAVGDLVRMKWISPPDEPLLVSVQHL